MDHDTDARGTAGNRSAVQGLRGMRDLIAQ